MRYVLRDVKVERAYLEHVREGDEEPPPDLRVVQPGAPHPRHDVRPVGRVVAHHMKELKKKGRKSWIFFPNSART